VIKSIIKVIQNVLRMREEFFMGITKKHYGKLKDGNNVDIFVLNNSHGMVAEITNYGGIIVSLLVPDKLGDTVDVALGHDNLEGYLENAPYFGAIIGRNSNRIENACFEINGKTYDVSKNSGEHQLHGGFVGFDKVLWNAEIINMKKNSESLKLTYYSIDGEEGFPGNLEVSVIYTITEENALVIEYHAVSDKDTVINLTNHSYFNLSGHASGTICTHKVSINADKFTVGNDQIIPNGEIKSVKGTPMDLTELTTIENGLKSDYDQIVKAGGYDHNWVLKVSGIKPELAASVFDEKSRRMMEVYTTSPGIQLYTGNFLGGAGYKQGATYERHSGLCLETQYFPNSLKHKHFPSPIFKAGEEYKHVTIYKFKNK